MGVADFGVTGTGGASKAYAYATRTLQGSALVHSMKITAGSGSSTFHVAAFELNALLVFHQGGTNYTYWIQNGLHLDSSNNQYTIGGAYVWNFSTPGAALTASELKGNASSVLTSNLYYFIPGCGGFAGQCSPLSLPATLTARIGVSTCGAYPCVFYQYNLGSGWVTYDSVSFLHLAGATAVGFLVDGSRYNPLGSFYDAEWIWAAAGGGSSGRDDGSNMQMTLDFWNGHNYQPVPGAWNFGGDTGETSFNVTNQLSSAAPDGAPVAVLSSGSGSLGVLYNATEVGFLNVTAPVASLAGLGIDGNPTDFQGGRVNLTLVSGMYSVSLQNYSNASVRVTVLAGQTTALNLSGAGRTAFEETGLPPTTTWNVSVGNSSRSGSGPWLTFNLPNGSYAVTYGAIPGFVRNSSAPGTLLIPTSHTILVVWRPFTFPVTVAESGLPAGTAWWVNASGTTSRGNGTSLEIRAPNGSTNYSVGSGYEFIATPAQGTIQVIAGRFSTVDVQFSYRPTYIAGTVTPDGAALTLDGVGLAVTGGRFNTSVIPGPYTLAASAPGYQPRTWQVNATAGNVTVETLSLSPNATHAPVVSSGAPPGPGTWVWVGLGVAVVAVVGAITSFLLRRRARSG